MTSCLFTLAIRILIIIQFLNSSVTTTNLSTRLQSRPNLHLLFPIAQQRAAAGELGIIMAVASQHATQRAAQRKMWLEHPPSAANGAPWYAFRSVAHRWVSQNPNSRENVMRGILERLFSRPFPSVRPPWLRNTTGRSLELDAFNSELRIAAEHNGIQHTVFPNPFHSTRAQFLAVQQRDRVKAELCEKLGIKLVVLPHDVPRDDIESFLVEHLHEELACAAVAVSITVQDQQTEFELLQSFGAIAL